MASPASTSHSIGRALSPSSTVHISAESVDQGGIATASETPVTVAHYLGLTPKWVDGTAVGGCSFMIHVRHAAAAIASGLCDTVLINPWRERPLRRRAHPQCRDADEPCGSAPCLPSPASGGGLGWGWTAGAADFVHDPGAALHEDLWPDARAIGDGLGRAARMAGDEPARHPSTNPRGSHSCSGI
jgi:hypothetical protein